MPTPEQAHEKWRRTVKPQLGGFTVGYCNGWHWKLLRICDVFQVPSTKLSYFLFKNDEATGDHFATLRELVDYVNSLPSVVDKENV